MLEGFGTILPPYILVNTDNLVGSIHVDRKSIYNAT